MPKRRRQTSTWKRILTFCYARATQAHTTSKLRDGLNTVLSGIFVRVVSRRHGSVMSCAQQDASWRPTVRTVVQARLGRLEDRNLVVRQANVIRCHSRRPPELFYLSSYPRFHWQIKNVYLVLFASALAGGYSSCSFLPPLPEP